MILQIINCAGNKRDVDIGNLEDILVIYVLVLTGDEILEVIKKNGEHITYDSCRYRMESIYNGSYDIYNSVSGLNDIEKWSKRKDSYDYMWQI